MIETAAIVLLVLWALGFLIAGVGVAIHLFLIAALALLAVHVLQGRSRTLV